MFKTGKKLQEEVNALKRELDELKPSVMGAEIEMQKLNNALYDYIDKTANWQKLQAERAMAKPTINWEVVRINAAQTIMAAIINNETFREEVLVNSQDLQTNPSQDVAQISVELADALIDELRKPVSNK